MCGILLDMAEKEVDGRPTKYDEQIQEIADDYVITYKSKYGDEVPSVCGLAVALDTTKKTLYNWSEKHKNFLHTLKKIKTTQEKALVNGGLGGQFQATIAKLMMANHGYHEKKELDHKVSTPVTVNIKPVENANDTTDSETLE